MMLTEEVIKKLVGYGMSRWTKGDMDRLYLNEHNGSVCGTAISDKLSKEMHGYGAKKCYINIETGKIVSDRAELRRIAERLLAEAEGRELPPKPARKPRKTKAEKEAELARMVESKVKGPLCDWIGHWCKENNHEKPNFRDMTPEELAAWFFEASGIDIRDEIGKRRVTAKNELMNAAKKSKTKTGKRKNKSTRVSDMFDTWEEYADAIVDGVGADNDDDFEKAWGVLLN